MWVAGEVSNFARPQSGHCYLTLKDDRAQLRAVMWRGVAVRLRFDLHDGLEVICRGHLDVYAAAGQLPIDHRGHRAARAWGRWSWPCGNCGRSWPAKGCSTRPASGRCRRFVRRIAVVTSPTGAAIRDFLQVLGRRWRGADVLVVPVRVQGEGAAAEIAAAIETVNRLSAEKGTVPIGGRRAVRQMGTVPFSAHRLPGRHPRRRQHGRPLGVQRGSGGPRHRRLADSGRLGRRPRDRRDAFRPGGRRAGADAQRGGRTGRAGGRGVGRRLAAGRAAAGGGVARRGRNRPARGWTRSPGTRPFAARISGFSSWPGGWTNWTPARLRAVRGRLRCARQQTDTAAGRLESLSPLAVLGRGYSLTQRTADGQVIRAAAELSPGEQITTRFARGQAISRVEQIEP